MSSHYRSNYASSSNNTTQSSTTTTTASPGMYDTSVSSNTSSPQQPQNLFNYFPNHSSSRGAPAGSQYTMTGYRKSQSEVGTRRALDPGLVAASMQFTAPDMDIPHNQFLMQQLGDKLRPAADRPQQQQQQPAHDESYEKAHSEPILTEQDRFSAYVNRFAHADHVRSSSSTQQQQQQRQLPTPRMTPRTRGGPQPFTAASSLEQKLAPPSRGPSRERGNQTLQQQQQQQQPPKPFNQPQHAPLSSYSPLNQQLTSSSAPKTTTRPYHRQSSIESSAAATVGSSTSSVRNRKLAEYAAEYPDPELDVTMASSTDDVRTTSSASTRPTRPSSSHEDESDPAAPEDIGRHHTARGRSPATRPQSRSRSQSAAPRGRSPSHYTTATSTAVPSTPSRGRSPSNHSSAFPSTPSRGRSPSATSSSVTSSVGRSEVSEQGTPGSFRTRDLAKRFEQRMQSKGKSGGLLQSAMQSAYQQQQQQQSSSQQQPQKYALPQHKQQYSQQQQQQYSQQKQPQFSQQQQQQNSVQQQSYYSQQPRIKPSLSDDPDEKKEGDRLQDSVAIETPEPSSVKDLRQRLWDEKEALQVQHRQAQKHYYTEEERGRLSETQPVSHTIHQQEELLNNKARQARSLSPRTSRNAYKSSSRVQQMFQQQAQPPPAPPQQPPQQQQPQMFQQQQQVQPSQQQQQMFQQQQQVQPSLQPPSQQQQQIFQQQQQVQPRQQQQAPIQQQSDRPATDSGSMSGSAGSGSAPRFKSKFYEAAAIASPEWAASSQNRSENSSGEERLLGAARMDVPKGPVPVFSQASTPKMGNHHSQYTIDQSVSELLRKLHSINRQDPTKALAEIDEILKQEAMKEDPTMQRALRVPEPSMQMPSLRNREEKVHDEEYESDSETTISSITNPTFSGHPRRSEMASDAPTDEHSSATRPERNSFRQPSSGRSSSLREGGDPESSLRGFRPALNQIAEDDAFRDRPRRSSRSNRASIQPPPGSITTKDKLRKDSQEGLQEGSLPSSTLRSEERRTNPAHVLDARASEDPSLLNNLYQSRPEELAEKIRKWDELSGNKEDAPTGTSRNKQGQAIGDELESSTTEDLGSIVTPRDTELSPLKHPWEERRPVNVRETSMQDAAGVEVIEPERPFFVKSPARYQQLGNKDQYDPYNEQTSIPPENSENMLNISDDFDNAWVALPTSRFFKSSTSFHHNPETIRSPPPEGPQPEQPLSPQRVSDSSDAVWKLTDAEDSPFSEVQRSFTDDSGGYGNSGVRGEEIPDLQVTRSESRGGDSAKPKRGLRALLARGPKHAPTGQAASIATGVSASSRRSRVVDDRGRRISLSSKGEMTRARSLDERRVRNPNIAKKFSRMLKVYGEDDRVYS